MKTARTSLRARHAFPARLFALAGAALAASPALAQTFSYINCPSKNYNDGRSNTAARGVVPYHGTRTSGGPVHGLWDLQNSIVIEINFPSRVEDGDRIESYAFAQTRGPGSPVKGIDVGLIKKDPIVQSLAFYANTEDDDVNQWSVHFLDDMGFDSSWATNVDASGRLIGGALYGSVGGGPESPRAVVWDHDVPTLLPLPAGTNASEVTGISADGLVRVGTISPQHSPRPQAKAIKEKGVQIYAEGIVWTPGGYSIVSPTVAGPDKIWIDITNLAHDNNTCLTRVGSTHDESKAGLYRISTGGFTLLDGGDINGDGAIDLLDDHDSAVFALSLDSSIAGGSITFGGVEMAMLWLNGPNGYQPVLAADYLTSFIGGTGQDGDIFFTSVNWISDDGLSFSGNGIAAAGYETVWYATVPAPGAATLAGLGMLLATRRRR